MICQFCNGFGRIKVKYGVYRKCSCQIPNKEYNRMQAKQGLRMWAARHAEGEEIMSKPGYRLAVDAAIRAGMTEDEIVTIVFHLSIS